MCCRTHVYPLHVETAVAVLTLGRFTPTYWQSGNTGVAVSWERALSDEGTIVTASLSGDSLQLTISPAISTFGDHFGKRIGAGVYFEIAAKYAEKVSGEIVQRATVAGCRMGGQSQELVIARYPRMPIDFERICRGFRAVILGEAAA